MASDVKWIKIITDIFDDEKILMIESMPSADSIIVIWFKLLTFAGKQNNDGVFLMNNRMAYTEEMFAAIFRRDVNIIRLALSTFEQLGMVKIINNVVTIPNWGKHQTLDAYEKKKARDRDRMAKKRAEQKALVAGSLDKSSDRSLDKSSDVAISDKEIEKEIEIEEDKEIYSIIVSYLNEKAGTKYKATTAKTKSLIKARLSEGFTVDDFKTVIDKKCSDWLNNAEYEKYLRPETLFGTKFEGYLNAKIGRSVNDGTDKSDSVGVEHKIGLWV